MANRKKQSPPPEKSLFVEKCEEILGRTIWSDPAVQWTTGGQSGGNCWDDSDESHYSVEGDKEPDFDELDRLIEGLCPNISFIQYKNLVKTVVEKRTWTDNEYYGNYYYRAEKSVNLHTLGQYLIEKNLWAK